MIERKLKRMEKTLLLKAQFVTARRIVTNAVTCGIDVANGGAYKFVRNNGQTVVAGYSFGSTKCQIDFSKLATHRVAPTSSVDDEVAACSAIECNFIWEDNNGTILAGKIQPPPSSEGIFPLAK